MMGGRSTTGPTRDAWRWDGTDWSAFAMPVVPTWDRPAAALDTARGVLVVPTRSEVLEWDGAAWTQVPLATPLSFDPVKGAFDEAAALSCFATADESLHTWDGAVWRVERLFQSSFVVEAMWWDAVQQRVQRLSGLINRLGQHDLWVRRQNPNINWEPVGPRTTGAADPRMATCSFPPLRGLLCFGGRAGGTQPVDATQLYWSPTVQPAVVQSFGTGCPGSAGLPELSTTPGYPPLFSTAFTAPVGFRLSKIAGATRNLLFLAVGADDALWGTIPLPADLGFLGGHGCSALTSAEIVVVEVNQGDPTDVYILLRLVQAQVGLRAFLQGAVFDAGAPNALGLSMTQGLEITLGSR